MSSDRTMKELIMCIKGIYEEQELLDIPFAEDSVYNKLALNLCNIALFLIKSSEFRVFLECSRNRHAYRSYPGSG
jgi:hypothetical protein